MANDFNKPEPRRFRVSVPGDDEAVIRWLDCQHSVSMSLRMLVRAAIETYGMRDFFASGYDEIDQKPKRGRPSNEEKQMREAQAQQPAPAVEHVGKQPSQPRPKLQPKPQARDDGGTATKPFLQDLQKFVDGD